ncbi:MAG TPA: aldolase [Terracidiphilus sp.]|jgi:hypothetical protein
MFIEEIDSETTSRLEDFQRHELEAPELCLRETYYPLGFPTEVATNSPEILTQASQLWSVFEQRFDTPPIRVDVHVVDTDSEECPPEPVFRMMQTLMVNVADGDNCSIGNLEQRRTQMIVSRAAEKYRSYLGYYFLGAAPLFHIASTYATPVHAGCVALNGRGVLLCGDSGAGKSTLSYACACSGMTYVTDDASYLVHGTEARLVTGNCHQVRFRPSAGKLFPEIEGHEITPRAAGKPSIELPTAMLPEIIFAPTAHVDYIVFLNRQIPEPPMLIRYSKDAARRSMRQVLFGPAKSLARQYVEIERLLTAEIFELRYSDLDWAIDRLETLMRKGC